MTMQFTEEELQGILDELANLPIKHMAVFQKIQSIFQQKYTEAEKALTNSTDLVDTQNV